MMVVGDVGLWCRGGGSGDGGQKAVGMVVAWWCRVCLVIF